MYPNQNYWQDPDQAIAEYVNRTFAMYDFDNSNTLEINEFAAYLQDYYANMGYGQVQLHPQQVEQMMIQIDANFDGHITREELHRYLKSFSGGPPMMPNYQPVQQPVYQQPVSQQPPQQRPTIIVIKGKNVKW